MGTIINRRRAMGRSLPYDAEIEYLESSGTQWIDTNFVPNVNSAAHIIWSPKEINFNGYFGSRSLGYDGLYRFCGTAFSNGAYFTFAMTYNTWPINRVALAVDAIYDCYAENGKYIINGTEYNSDVLSYYQGSTFCLFRYYTGNYFYLSKMRCYVLKLYSNNVIVMDMIPVRVGTTGYMYDKVSGQLFGNAGTGAFILGPDKGTAVIITQQQQHEMYG